MGIHKSSYSVPDFACPNPLFSLKHDTSPRIHVDSPLASHGCSFKRPTLEQSTTQPDAKDINSLGDPSPIYSRFQLLVVSNTFPVQPQNLGRWSEKKFQPIEKGTPARWGHVGPQNQRGSEVDEHDWVNCWVNMGKQL
jgi:hypothetical protein